MPLTIAERESLDNVDRGRGLVARRAGEARRLARERDHARMRLTDIEVVNPMIVRPDRHHTTFYWMFALCMVAAYVLDAILFAPALEELTARTLAGSPFWLVVARFSVPAVIVLFETTIGAARDRARDHIYEQPSSRVVWLTLLGLALALVMPGMVAYTQIAAYLANPEPDRWEVSMLIAKLVSLTALSLAVHMFLVLAGREGNDAKAYVVSRMHHWHWGRRLRQSEDAYDHALQGTDDVFARYETARLDHNVRFPNLRREQGPFDPDTINLLNRGRSPAPPSSQGAAATPSFEPRTEPPPPATPAGTVHITEEVPPQPGTTATPESGLHSGESEVT